MSDDLRAHPRDYEQTPDPPGTTVILVRYVDARTIIRWHGNDIDTTVVLRHALLNLAMLHTRVGDHGQTAPIIGKHYTIHVSPRQAGDYDLTFDIRDAA